MGSLSADAHFPASRLRSIFLNFSMSSEVDLGADLQYEGYHRGYYKVAMGATIRLLQGCYS